MKHKKNYLDEERKKKKEKKSLTKKYEDSINSRKFRANGPSVPYFGSSSC